LRLQGFTALRADDPAAAARSFAALLARPDVKDLDGAIHEAWWRARVLSGDRDAPLAEAEARAEHEASSLGRFDYALLLWLAKRDALARAQLELLAAKPETHAAALRMLGLLEFQTGNDEAASARFNELLTAGAHLDDVFYHLGLLADRHGDLERALRAYAHVQAGENALPALLRAATILYKHGAAAQAEDLLTRAADESADRVPQIVAARANMYALAGDAPHARAVLEQALQQYPDSVELHFALATQDEAAGRLDAALLELESLLKQRPDDPAALNALGYTLADHARQLRRAQTLIARAYAAAPKSAAIRDSLGWVLFRQGRAAQALTYLTEAFADEPGGDIGAHLGEVLWQLDRHDEAERVWSAAHRIDSDNRLLDATRLRLHTGERAGG
jgi:tetratricopeptide (TPR) repeat protein